MYLIIKNHTFIYNVQSVVQIFFQNETFVNKEEVQDDGYSLTSVLEENVVTSTLYFNKEKLKSFKKEVSTDISYDVKISVFLLLKDYFNYYPSYGILTGIRPTKLVQKLIGEGKSNEEIKEVLSEKYLVQDDKIDFLLNVSKNEMETLLKIDVNKNALYIGIPFCPSICAYCSFTSFNMKKYRKNGLMDLYVDKLIEEIEYVFSISGNEIENIYIGGGTPTSLDDKNFEKLLKKINELVEVKSLKEFTVEAGRVDTINKNNLELMKKYNVSRISINAQSMNNETLKLNGRTHTKEDFVKTFLLAREVGFTYINVDMIVGLLGEDENSIKNTLEEILELKPENITIHTLAIKKGSAYKQNLNEYNFIDNINLKNTLDSLYVKLYKNNYIPYYMYRQKNILGNFENTGFSLKGYESIYNVSMILEVQSIIGTGAGSASKLIKDDVVRGYNLKGVEEYIENFDVILDRKDIFKG